MSQAFRKGVGAVFLICALVALVVLLIAFILMSPVFTIWSLNCLFNLSIPVTLSTWLSSMWLASIVGGAVTAVNRSKKKGD